jgi:hypothetical protein
LTLFLVSRQQSQVLWASAYPDNPRWKFNVRTLGYELQQGRKALAAEPLSFVTESMAVVTFVTYVGPSALSHRGQIDDSVAAYRLHAVFLDTSTGQVVSTHEWPTASQLSRIFRVAGDKFVVLTPDRLILYSADFSLLNQIDLPLSRDAVKDYWNVAVSPGGKNFLINYEPVSEERRVAALPRTQIYSEPVDVRFEWIGLENLEVLARWTTKGCLNCFSIVGISDDGMVQRWKTALSGSALNSKVVEIGKPPDGPWRDLCSYYQPYCRPGKFVNGETVLSVERTKGFETIWLFDTSGEMLFRQTFGENENVSWQGSADGRRLAVAVRKIKGSNAILDIGGHAFLDRIMIFDVPSRRWVYVLDTKRQKIKDISGMALTIDGAALGVIDQDGVLEMYPIPETPDVQKTR